MRKSKTIWQTIPIIISGAPEFLPQPDATYCYNLSTDIASTCTATFENNTYANNSTDYFALVPAGGIAKGSGGLFEVIVGDFNLNKLQGGTTIKATASSIASVPTNTTTPTNSITVSPSEYTVDDNFSPTGPTPFFFTVTIPGDYMGTATTVTVEVTTPNGTKNKIFTIAPIN
jgi:hypothetical protein